MSAMSKIVVVIVTILVVVGVLSLSAGDKPAELDEYSSLEVGFGLLFITSPLWVPLALTLALMPRRRE